MGDKEGIQLSTKRITLSTSGIVPKILEWGNDVDTRLAISLHAPNDKIRDEIVPINLKDGKVSPYKRNEKDWSINLIDTGINTMTGGRLKRLKEFIGDETFLLTYGDAVTDLNINKVLEFHKKHGKMVTVTAVHPVARFGELNLEGDKVNWFKEKPQTVKGWINGGFFVIEPEFFNYIDSDQTILEKEPLEEIAKRGQLMAYKHDGFWQCMDTRRDKDFLEEMWNKSRPLWIS